jgi:hypothetical protein
MLDIEGQKRTEASDMEPSRCTTRDLTSLRPSGRVTAGSGVCCMHRYELDPVNQFM